MAIELISDLRTVRTYPRLMRHRVTDRIVLVLHDHNNGIVWLSGPDTGRVLDAKHTDWDGLDDFHGSVTIHNRD